MRNLTTIAVWLALLLAATACIQRGGNSGGGARSGSQQAPGAPKLRVTLLCTDLGLGDGDFVRSADAELEELALDGLLDYDRLGTVPAGLMNEAMMEDVGLPIPDGTGPGEMTLVGASAMLDSVPETDILVVSSGYLAPDVRERLADGRLHAKAVVLLDEQGIGAAAELAGLPIYRIRYDIRHMAFAAGVASGASANVAHFGIMYAEDDPQGERFASAAEKGVLHESNGAWTQIMSVPVGPEGYVTPQDFSVALGRLRSDGGEHFKPNHYILALGRSTPSIANALSKKPNNAYIATGYADYRQVRPARLIGCALKRPGPALRALFTGLGMQAQADPAAALAAATDSEGVYLAGLEQNAVGFTPFDLYSRYNEDSDEIEKTVAGVIGSIRAGELTAEY